MQHDLHELRRHALFPTQWNRFFVPGVDSAGGHFRRRQHRVRICRLAGYSVKACNYEPNASMDATSGQGPSVQEHIP